MIKMLHGYVGLLHLGYSIRTVMRQQQLHSTRTHGNLSQGQQTEIHVRTPFALTNSLTTDNAFLPNMSSSARSITCLSKGPFLSPSISYSLPILWDWTKQT